MGACLGGGPGKLSGREIQRRYLLSNRVQASALKKYCEKMGISLALVDKVYGVTKNSLMDVGGDVIKKDDLLNMMDINSTPFSVGALNSLESKDRAGFFEVFAAVHNYCTFDESKLIAHTFALTDEDNDGRLTAEELKVLVHYVYGQHVSKSEAGFIVTTNKTDIETAKTVMRTMDPQNRGWINCKQFAEGVKKHSNLLSPAFQCQAAMRRECGGGGLWKKEAERLKKHCYANALEVFDVFKSVSSKMREAEMRGGGGDDDDDDDDRGSVRGVPKGVGHGSVKGGLRGTQNDLSGYKRPPRDELALGEASGLRLKAAAGLASASHAFAHKSAVKSQQWVTSFEAEDRHTAMRRDAEKSTAVRGGLKGGSGDTFGGKKWGQTKGAVKGAAAAKAAGAAGKRQGKSAEAASGRGAEVAAFASANFKRGSNKVAPGDKFAMAQVKKGDKAVIGMYREDD
mmetsp:Transcript_51674/g.117673  ORF Transcript_51674/g.117673 Transcript_51674/m.117673 type:complete len:456 (-) Transcript_51674:150-1517(-)|eukprot:CAMPEP_0172594086 /NCGR_PEP_ID=MMETSP1068-20121228/13376_1 /TAXON_ID=35684 /ORGANISM="Pseudopedinella elastica, Strain CCMP716" /LENGTH=455 /DNA_ID=CAMNT_0013391899 /DNA_START=195 /DNA_END=1562 /DNA_ORIENTATION=-